MIPYNHIHQRNAGCGSSSQGKALEELGGELIISPLKLFPK